MIFVIRAGIRLLIQLETKTQVFELTQKFADYKTCKSRPAIECGPAVKEVFSSLSRLEAESARQECIPRIGIPVSRNPSVGISDNRDEVVIPK